MNEHAKQLIDALRSGDYHQCQGRLRQGDTFCCLGVACDLFQRETGRGRWSPSMRESHESLRAGRDTRAQGQSYEFYADSNQTRYELPIDVRDWLGFRNRTGFIESRRDSLAGLNDTGATFATIADLIESEPEGLFA